MAQGRSSLHLNHMLDNIERILGWVGTAELDAYLANTMLRDAVRAMIARQ